MKTVVFVLCLSFLIGALAIPAFVSGAGASATAAILKPCRQV